MKPTHETTSGTARRGKVSRASLGRTRRQEGCSANGFLVVSCVNIINSLFRLSFRAGFLQMPHCQMKLPANLQQIPLQSIAGKLAFLNPAIKPIQSK